MSEENPISLTETAKQRVSSLMKLEAKDLKFRVYIVGGGCSGFTYGFSFDETVNEDDFTFNVVGGEDAIQVVIDSLSLQYLEGSTIDYVVDLQGSRFAVNNPHAVTTCGCGASFSLDI